MDLNDLIEDIKLGRAKTERMTVHYDNKEYDLEFRHLTVPEVQRVRSITSKKITITGNMSDGNTELHIKPMTADVLADANYEAKLLAISLSLTVNDTKLTKDDVEKLFESEVIDEIYENIQEVNGLSENDLNNDTVKEIENFRKD